MLEKFNLEKWRKNSESQQVERWEAISIQGFKWRIQSVVIPVDSSRILIMGGSSVIYESNL